MKALYFIVVTTLALLVVLASYALSGWLFATTWNYIAVPQAGHPLTFHQGIAAVLLLTFAGHLLFRKN